MLPSLSKVSLGQWSGERDVGCGGGGEVRGEVF